MKKMNILVKSTMLILLLICLYNSLIEKYEPKYHYITINDKKTFTLISQEKKNGDYYYFLCEGELKKTSDLDHLVNYYQTKNISFLAFFLREKETTICCDNAVFQINYPNFIFSKEKYGDLNRKYRENDITVKYISIDELSKRNNIYE